MRTVGMKFPQVVNTTKTLPNGIPSELIFSKCSQPFVNNNQFSSATPRASHHGQTKQRSSDKQNHIHSFSLFSLPTPFTSTLLCTHDTRPRIATSTILHSPLLLHSPVGHQMSRTNASATNANARRACVAGSAGVAHDYHHFEFAARS